MIVFVKSAQGECSFKSLAGAVKVELAPQTIKCSRDFDPEKTMIPSMLYFKDNPICAVEGHRVVTPREWGCKVQSYSAGFQLYFWNVKEGQLEKDASLVTTFNPIEDVAKRWLSENGYKESTVTALTQAA